MNPSNPRRWLLVKREQGIPDTADGGNRWSVDHLFVDQDGVPTLVEVKRSTDTRIRREVVGQMLDYAANGVRFWPAADLQRAYEATRASLGADPHEGIVALTEDPEALIEEFFTRVEDNLRSGRIRMVFVADIIPSELRAIVEFLNEQLDPGEVFAVEVKQYRADGHDSLVIVPTVYGQTATAARKERSPRTFADRQRLIEASLPETREVLALLLKLAAEHGFHTKETPAGLLVKTRRNESLSNLYLSAWNAVDVPLKPLRERGWSEEADALHTELQRMTTKPLTDAAPSIPAPDVASHWPEFESVIRRVADLYG